MARLPSLADRDHSLVASTSATAAPAFAALEQTTEHNSVAMEPSVSSSSVSSSIFSLRPSLSSTSSAPSPFFLPKTPQRRPQTALFDQAAQDSLAGSGTVNMEKGKGPACALAPDAKKSLDISNLMSPPEPDQFDSFSINNDEDDESRRGSIGNAASFLNCTPPTATSISRARSLNGAGGVPVPRNGPLSPPISPKDRKSSTASADTPLIVTQATRDPILYPAASDGSSSTSQSRPLFADADTAGATPSTSLDDANQAATADVVNGHVAARSSTLFGRATPPRGEDYELVLYLKSEVMKRYMTDRRAWLEKEREQLRADRRAAADRSNRLRLLPYPAKSSSTPLQRVSAPRTNKPQHLLQGSQPSSLSQHPQQLHQHHQHHQHEHIQQQHRPSSLLPVQDGNSRVVKRVSRPAPASRAGVPPRIAPQVTGTPRHAPNGNGASMRVPGSSPEPRIRTAAPNREDKDFMSLPDYCPPLSTLPERTNNLKVDWKGNALDLSRDPYLHLLHRDEIGLAASLRLDCATYLTSKRRIFIRRLECARIGKEFRKTDAQQACKIDVNKASKLWTAYEKVGWLRIEHMRPFI